MVMDLVVLVPLVEMLLVFAVVTAAAMVVVIFAGAGIECSLHPLEFPIFK